MGCEVFSDTTNVEVANFLFVWSCLEDFWTRMITTVCLQTTEAEESSWGLVLRLEKRHIVVVTGNW